MSIDSAGSAGVNITDLNIQPQSSENVGRSSSLGSLNFENQLLAQYDYSAAKNKFNTSYKKIASKVSELTTLIGRIDPGAVDRGYSRSKSPKIQNLVKILASAAADAMQKREQIKLSVDNQAGRDPFNIKSHYEKGNAELNTVLVQLNKARQKVVTAFGGEKSLPINGAALKGPFGNSFQLVDWLKGVADGFGEWFMAPSKSKSNPPAPYNGRERVY